MENFTKTADNNADANEKRMGKILFALEAINRDLERSKSKNHFGELALLTSLMVMLGFALFSYLLYKGVKRFGLHRKDPSKSVQNLSSKDEDKQLCNKSVGNETTLCDVIVASLGRERK